MGLTNEDVERVLRIIDESGYDEIRLEHDGLKLHVRRHGVDAPPPATATWGAPASPIPAACPTPVASAASPTPPAPAGPARSTDTAGPSQEAMTKAVPGPSNRQVPEGLIAVRAPMLGTFYRCPSPGSPPFVEEGQSVRVDDTVCLLEVMKLFNTLKAGVEGRVVRFLVENGAMVEYDEPLLLIDPNTKG